MDYQVRKLEGFLGTASKQFTLTGSIFGGSQLERNPSILFYRSLLFHVTDSETVSSQPG